MSIRRGRNTVCQWSARRKKWCYNYAHGIADNNNVLLISQEVLDSGDLACLGCVSQIRGFVKYYLTYMPTMMPSRAVLMQAMTAVRRFLPVDQFLAIGCRR
jgi:hypothetical protein